MGFAVVGWGVCFGFTVFVYVYFCFVSVCFLVWGGFFCFLGFFTEQSIHLCRIYFSLRSLCCSLSPSRHHQPSSSFSSFLLASSLHGVYAIGMMTFQRNSRPFHACLVTKLLSIVSLFSYTAHTAGPGPGSFQHFLPLHLQDTFGKY